LEPDYLLAKGNGSIAPNRSLRRNAVPSDEVPYIDISIPHSIGTGPLTSALIKNDPELEQATGNMRLIA